MKKISAIIYIALWTVCLIAVGVYYVTIAPKDATYSEVENRNLAGLPELTAESLFSGDYGQDIESYLLDRFPKRNEIISVSNDIQGTMSFATYEEYLLIAEDVNDPLDTDDYENNIEDLLGQMNNDNNPIASEQETTSEEETTTELQENPPIEQKPVANVEDYPTTFGVYMEMNGKTYTKSSYARDNVLAVTAVLNRYANLLPEDGKLMFTVVPQSRSANQFVNATDKVAYYANWDDAVNAFGGNNVYAFDAAEIMTSAILKNEYVYFRTDMHWTPYGSYLLYKDMVERAGLEACDYELDFSHSLETPFRGTYYRDNAAAYMDVTPDDLDILTPNCPLEWRRITGKDEYKLIDFINMNAKKNDRYTVYLSGPGGPWTYAECDNGKEENCLVLMDSFGLGYLPFLTANYKQVHYYDPRYFDKSVVGYSVAEMIEKYNIQDIYVVVGDLHSFDSGFIMTNANNQLED